jgi:mutator protein MutT
MTAPRSPHPLIVVVAAVVTRDDSFLVTRRPRGVHLEGFWEFPGGKCHAGETHEQCLRREMAEELDVDVSVADKVHATHHRYPDRTVELHFYRCALAGEPQPRLGQEMRWVARRDLSSLSFPPADEELIARLVAGGPW